MQVSTISATLKMLQSAIIHAANGRGILTNWRFDQAIWKSYAEQGFQPKIDAVTGTPDLPAATMEGDCLAFVRGAGRMGTLILGLTNPKQYKCKPEHVSSVLRMLDSGEVTINLIEGASDSELLEIGSDDDALKREWSPVHRFYQYKALVLAGYTQLKACRKVGYGGVYGHFTRLEKLPQAVQQAWIDGKIDATKPQVSDTVISEIYKSQNDSDSLGNEVLCESAQQIFDKVMTGKPAVIAKVASDKQLARWQRELVGTPYADLIAIVRGRKPGSDSEILASDEARGVAIVSFIKSVRTTDKAPEDKAPEDKAPEDKAPEDKAPEDKAPEIPVRRNRRKVNA